MKNFESKYALKLFRPSLPMQCIATVLFDGDQSKSAKIQTYWMSHFLFFIFFFFFEFALLCYATIILFENQKLPKLERFYLEKIQPHKILTVSPKFK